MRTERGVVPWWEKCPRGRSKPLSRRMFEVAPDHPHGIHEHVPSIFIIIQIGTTQPDWLDVVVTVGDRSDGDEDDGHSVVIVPSSIRQKPSDRISPIAASNWQNLLDCRIKIGCAPFIWEGKVFFSDDQVESMYVLCIYRLARSYSVEPRHLMLGSSIDWIDNRLWRTTFEGGSVNQKHKSTLVAADWRARRHESSIFTRLMLGCSWLVGFFEHVGPSPKPTDFF